MDCKTILVLRQAHNSTASGWQEWLNLKDNNLANIISIGGVVAEVSPELPFEFYLHIVG